MFNMPIWKKVTAYVELIRPYNVTAGLLIFLIGYYFQPHATDWVQLSFGAIMLILFHSAATVQNDSEDAPIDKANNLGRPLPEIISLAQARKFMQILFAGAFVVSIFNLALNRFFVPFLVALIWLYNAKPFYFSRKPILSILTLGAISTGAPLVYGFLLAGNTISTFAIVWMLSWFLIRISITLLKDYKDEKGDRLFHKRTFYLTYGKRVTAITSIRLAAIGYICLFAVSYFLKHTTWLLAIPFLFALISFLPRFSLIKIKDNKVANVIFHDILVKENRFELIYLLWIIFSR